MKTIVSLLILLSLFSINTFAANSAPRQKRTLSSDSGEIWSIAFSPDGLTLASGHGWRGYGINVWDVMSGNLKSAAISYTEEATRSVAFSPEGRLLASGTWDQKVLLWDMASEQLTAVLTGHSERVQSVAFSPEGSRLASGSLDKTVRLWDVASEQPVAILIGHTFSVNSVAFSPEGRVLASASDDRTVRLWDMASGAPKTTLIIEHPSEVSSVVFSPGGRVLASASGDTVRLWDVASGQRLAVLTGHSERIRSIVFSPDGRVLASASNDRTVRLWDMASGQPIAVLTGHRDRVTSVAFSPDANTLASSGDREDRTVILWDLSASATTPAVLSLSPISIKPRTIGEHLTVSLNIAGGENVMGYQATVVFDPDALIYFSSANGDYLSGEAFLVVPVVAKNYVTLESASLAGGSDEDGRLATITFQVVDAQASRVFLSQATLVDPEGERLFPGIENGTLGAETTEAGAVIQPVHRAEDINDDGVVNVQDLVLVSANFGQRGENKADVNADGVVDIVDLVKVAGAFGNAAPAPAFHPQTLVRLRAADVRGWLGQAEHLKLTESVSQRGIRFLEQLLAVLTPKETALLPNYPNPFNPETWIPYQVSESADVTVTIYAVDGQVVRTLAVGHTPAGVYQSKVRAAYWDGKNQVGEPVASGVYFYTLTAGNFAQTRRMLIFK